MARLEFRHGSGAPQIGGAEPPFSFAQGARAGAQSRFRRFGCGLPPFAFTVEAAL